MNSQLPQQQFTPEQGQQARQEILRLVQEANLPAEVLVEIGKWAQQVITQPALFPEFQAWLKSRGLEDSDIPTEPDYQELASMVAIGNVAEDLVEPAPEPSSAPVEPVSPEQMASMAQQGRNGDTMLAHINAEEAAVLQQMGGTGTINPATGLPEYGFFKDLWNGIKKVAKVVAPYVLPVVALTMPALIPAIGTAFGASTALAPIIGASVIAGGATALSGGSVKDVLTSATLTGLGSYLTPIVGDYVGGLTGIESAGLKAALGSAVFSGGVTAARGGSVSQILTSAATGAAANYLGQVASNAINSGKIVNTRITQDTFDDAVFVAADAKGLADQGLNKFQIARILESTGLSSTLASQTASMAVAGNSADTMAIALSNSYGQMKSLYNNGNDGVKNSVIGGGNSQALEQVQKVEDAMLVSQDAKNIADTLKQQGITGRAAQPAIIQNLVANGVDLRAAEYISDSIISNYTVQATANGVNQYLGTAELFGTPAAAPPAGYVKNDQGVLVPRGATVTGQTIAANATDNLSDAAAFVAQDVKSMHDIGLSQTQIRDTLIAGGVDPVVADQASRIRTLTEADIGKRIQSLAAGKKLEIFPNYEPPKAVVPETPAAPTTQPTTPPTTTPQSGNTNTQVFDDGSVLVTDPKTGAPISYTDTDGAVTVVQPPPAPAPRPEPAPEPAPAPKPQPAPEPTPQPAPQPAPPPPPAPTPVVEPDLVSTNVQFFDDGSVLVTGADGAVIGYIDSSGVSPGLDLQIFDDGSVMITNSLGDPLGGVDNTGDVFRINSQGIAVYNNGTRLDQSQVNAPNIDVNGVGEVPTPVEPGYGEGYPENVDISGSTPPPEPPVPEEPETVIDDIPHSDTEKPIDVETPVAPELPYIPPYIPPEETPPAKPPQGTYVPAAPDPRYLGRLPLPGLNPGYMEQGVEPMYQTTSPVQSQYYWGNQRGFTDLADLEANYNRINNVPEQPWGAQQGWWEQPRVNPATYNYDMSFQPVAPQGQLPGYYGTPNVDYTRIAQNYVPVAPVLTPISEYTLSRGQYYDANGNPVAG